MKTTRYLIRGLESRHDITLVRERLSDLAVAEGIGATNVERYEDRDVLNIKHRGETTPSLDAIRAAVALAGDFTVEPLP